MATDKTGPTYSIEGHGYSFTPFDGPLDGGSDELFADLGRAVMCWARVEHLLIALALHINKEAASAQLYDRDPQSKLWELLKLVAKWTNAHPKYADLRGAFDQRLMEVARADSKLRNEIVHSLLESVNSDGSFLLKRFERVGKNEWLGHAYTYDAKTLGYLLRQGTTLGRHINEVFEHVLSKERNERS